MLGCFPHLSRSTPKAAVFSCFPVVTRHASQGRHPLQPVLSPGTFYLHPFSSACASLLCTLSCSTLHAIPSKSQLACVQFSLSSLLLHFCAIYCSVFNPKQAKKVERNITGMMFGSNKVTHIYISNMIHLALQGYPIFVAFNNSKL